MRSCRANNRVRHRAVMYADSRQNAQEEDRVDALTISFSQDPSCGLEVENHGGSTLTSNSVGRCNLRRGVRPPPNPPVPSSEGESSMPPARASSRRRRNRRRRKMPRMMMAEEIARRRKRVARNVKLRVRMTVIPSCVCACTEACGGEEKGGQHSVTWNEGRKVCSVHDVRIEHL